MKNIKLLTVTLMALAISSGTFITSAQQQEAKERKQRSFDAEQIKETRLEKLKTELNLTEQQEAEVKALMDERQKEMEKNREQRDAAMKAVRERQQAHDTKMKNILTPEQYAKYEQLNQAQRAEMMEKMKERRKDRMDGRNNKMPKGKPVQD
jgi:Spy/CpxP family protein refolding chaperone